MACTKGAMDNILARSASIIINGAARPITEQDKQDIAAAAYQVAKSALRVLGLAVKPEDASASEEGLTFVGLVGMIDPPRPEAKSSVDILKSAGVRTVMITGDHRDTALAIARELGICDDESQCMTGQQLSGMTQEELNAVIDDLRVFARVSPEHKVLIVRALKSRGYIVSMTGDGVNDAPSLKAADIGVAMGITGTDVAKGAADMVLTDDNFSTIEKAVEEGRNIYGNIRKSVLFLLSANFGEVIAMITAIAAGFSSPLKAIHILGVNLVTDTLPGLALGVDPVDKDLMKLKPRDPKESLFAHGGLTLTTFYGLIIALITLGAFVFVPIQNAGWDFYAIKSFLTIDENLQVAQTFAFSTLAVSQLFHAVGMRNTRKSVFRLGVLSNKTMLVAFSVGMLLQIAVTELPFLTAVFGTVRLSLAQWGQILLFAVVPLVVHELIVLARWIAGKIAR
jgi:Ca2+-transporting ATPase